MPTNDALNDTSHSTATTATQKKAAPKPMATVGETLAFVFECGGTVQMLFCFGCIGGFFNGLVYPILAYLFSDSFSDIAGATDGLAQVREVAYSFMVVGTYALVVGTIQSWNFELVAYYASQNLRLKWFQALLRQDPAYFDVYEIGGIANQIGANSNKFRRGIGRKFGEGVQFGVTGLGGLAYAFYASWKVALVVLSVLPFISVAAMMLLTLNQTKGSRAAKAYTRAGGVAYSSVSAIKTVLSLNAIGEFLQQYSEATQEAFKQATAILVKQGFANGSMLGSFLCLYLILTLYGTALLYRSIQDTGCDPSDSVADNETCGITGPDVFGAMLGVAFAAQGVSQFGNFAEAFSAARVSVYEALHSINRKPGAPEETIYKTAEDYATTTTRHSKHSKKDGDNDEEMGSPAAAAAATPEKEIKAILPKYEIDSFSTAGLKPEIKGAISLKDVRFTYPTRPGEEIIKGLSVEITPGQTVAFVGPSGSGKSTIVSLLERFYDPMGGSVELDGINLKDLNVKHLRSSIGYVGQEPTLFATTIKGNIQYGNPNATMEQIEEAARLANAHDFITSFSDGYDTQVGDKGSQLSGGQKQRIAIARILVGNPSILLLDEATSALDAESELVVQDALDNILQNKSITTVIIAHRLSTIRNADVINVLVQGELKESGNHDALMANESYYYRLVQKQDGSDSNEPSTPGVSSHGSEPDLTKLTESAVDAMKSSISANAVPQIQFKDVTFAYPTRPKRIIFDDFNLIIEKGQTVALVGPSGGGKSTTVGLIERFYDPSAGTVEFQGVDLRSLNVGWYRDQIGYVGQEPVLFNDTIARNIEYASPGVSRAAIEEACKQANCHDFIMDLPEGYDTPVGERGTQLSGGQKQRVAIARALVKKPAVLILDEATSALDNESEALVQAAIDKLMESNEHTVVVIAHRLSTIRNADKIAVIGEGKVLEYGSHEELIEKPHGRYKRLFESSKRSSTMTSVGLKKAKGADAAKVEEKVEEEVEVDWEAEIEEQEKKAFSSSRAMTLIYPESGYMILGSIGAVMAGGVFPMWGVIFSEMIDLLFTRVESCPNDEGLIPGGFPTCEDYWSFTVDEMKDTSFTLAGYWALIIGGCIFGNIITFYGFGMASERLNKRVRDQAYEQLLRQEVAYFDKRSVGKITSELQDDAARLHAFSAEPVRSFLIAMSSVITGVTLSFIFMWPFALLAIGCVPLMGFATSMEMKQFLGEDESDTGESTEGLNTPGGIIVETLLNMRTVSALTLESERFADYERALEISEPHHGMEAFMSGVTGGCSQFIQQWINALQLWFGGWLLFNFPEDYSFKDFLISDFAVLFSLFGLGAAFQDMSDRKEVEKSAGRIFYLLDRQSEIDPLSTEGKKLS